MEGKYTEKPKKHIETEEQVQEIMNKPEVTVMFGSNPYGYGTSEYFQWKKDKQAHDQGLTKKIFNLYSNK